MKKLLLISTLMISMTEFALAISYQTMEYKPKGKNYVLNNSSAVYGYIPSTSGDAVWIFYGRRNNSEYFLTCILVSKSLEQRLPMIVLRYIGNNVASPKMKEIKSIDEIKAIIQKTIARALDQQYKNKLLIEGALMAKDSSYQRGHCNTNWWMPDYYYDYVPTFSKDTTNGILTNKIDDKSFPHLGYVTDQLSKFNYHHDLKALAKWPDKVMGGSGFERYRYVFTSEPIKTDQGYHNRNDSCFFMLKKISISHGKKYPKFASVSIFGWYATYCNFFASDLQKKVFGNPLWVTEGCKKDFDNLKLWSDFAEIKRKDIPQYSNGGYFVISISDGHVNTIFPRQINEKEERLQVIQAGGITGFLPLIESFNFEKTDVKHYLYLGYLKK